MKLKWCQSRKSVGMQFRVSVAVAAAPFAMGLLAFRSKDRRNSRSKRRTAA